MENNYKLDKLEMLIKSGQTDTYADKMVNPDRQTGFTTGYIAGSEDTLDRVCDFLEHEFYDLIQDKRIKEELMDDSFLTGILLKVIKGNLL